MKTKFQIAVALVALTSVAAPVNAQVKGDKIPGSYVCVFKKEAVARGNVQNEANRIAQENGGQIIISTPLHLEALQPIFPPGWSKT